MKIIAAALLATTVLSGAAFAQTTAPATTTTTTTTTMSGGQWRTSKLMGLDIYNDQNEKLGDVSEVLIDQSGKVTGVVIGVGGFLGMGQRDIMVSIDKLKFVNEPMRTANTGSSAPSANAPATAPRTANAESKWYPDHAILSGATKDSLKAMPEFNYN